MRFSGPSSLSRLNTFHAQAGANSLSVHWRTAKGVATRLNVHTLILRDILRSVLAEVAEVVVKLHCEVASHNAVPRILRIATTYGTRKGRILIQEVVNADKHLALTILKELLAEVDVTQQVVFVVVVRKAYILVVVYRCGERKALPEYPLESTRSAWFRSQSLMC